MTSQTSSSTSENEQEQNEWFPVAQLISLRELLFITRRNKWVIAFIMILMMVIGTLFMYFMPPYYMGSSFVAVNAQTDTALNYKSVASQIALSTSAITSETNVLQSLELTDRVIKKLALDQDPEFTTPRFSIVAFLAGLFTPHTNSGLSHDEIVHNIAVTNFQSLLTITPVPSSYTFEIDFQSKFLRKAVLIANTIADEYIALGLDKKYAATHAVNQFIHGQLVQLEKNLTDSQYKVEKFREDNGLLESIYHDVKTDLTQQELSELNQQLSLAHVARVAAESKYNNALRTPEACDDVLKSYVIGQLRTQEVDLKDKRAELSDEYGPKDPKIVLLDAQITDIHEKINTEIGKVVTSVTYDYQVAVSVEQDLKKMMKNLEAGNGTIAKENIELTALQRDVAANQAIYQSFVTRYNQTLDSTDIEVPDARIASYSLAPLSPYFPKAIIIIPLAFFLGMLISGITIYILETMDITFKNKKAVEVATNLPVLGMLPRMRYKDAHQEHFILYLDALKNVFMSLNLTYGVAPKILMVTSSVAKEGNTFFTYFFAQALAKNGKKVLLIDANLNHAELTQQVLSHDIDHGFHEITNQQVNYETLIMKDLHPGLDFIPCKPVNMDLQESFGSKAAMEALLARLRPVYDHIIIDAPPMVNGSDPILLSEVVDLCLFIIRWGYTPRDVVKTSINMLKEHDAHLVLVITGVDFKKLKVYDPTEAAFYNK